MTLQWLTKKTVKLLPSSQENLTPSERTIGAVALTLSSEPRFLHESSMDAALDAMKSVETIFEP